MIDFLINIDTEILLFLNSLHAHWLDSFMSMATGRFVWVPMYATILFILFRTFPRREACIYTVGVVLAIVFADQICATVLRPQFERLRPSNPDNPVSELVHIVDDYRGGRYGFPSCHGSNSFALATILALIVGTPRFTRFIFFWAALNAYTRLYLGVHYPGDLITGAAIGSAGAAAIYYAMRGLASLYNRRVPDSRKLMMSASKEESRVLFAYPAGMLAPVMRLNVVNVRVFDVLPAVGASTMLVLFACALF